MTIKLTQVRYLYLSIPSLRSLNSFCVGILPRLLKDLHMAGIITEDLALPDDMQSLEAIYRGLCKLPDRVGDNGEVVPSKRRRLDFLSVPWEHRGAALLYYTVR